MSAIVPCCATVLSNAFSPSRHGAGRRTLPRLLVAFSLLAAVGALTTGPASAQTGPEAGIEDAFLSPIDASLRGTAGLRRGTFGKGADGAGWGVHGFLGTWIGPSPLAVGLDVGIVTRDRSADAGSFREATFRSASTPRAPLRVTTTESVLQTHVSVRLQRRQGRLRPFVEGLFGFQYLYTRTSVDVREGRGVAPRDPGAQLPDGPDGVISERDARRRTHLRDLVLSGGAGAGIDVRLYRDADTTGASKPASSRSASSTGLEMGVQSLSLNLGVQYLVGQEATHLAGASRDDEYGGRLDAGELKVRRSRVTYLQPQIGITMRLRGPAP
jgi:hypothetical protein